MQRVRLTILTGERWPGATRSLLFGMRALKIELHFDPPSRSRPMLTQYRTQLLMFFCACHPLSLPCSHFYAFCFPSELLLDVIIAKYIIFFFHFVCELPIFSKLVRITWNFGFAGLGFKGFPRIVRKWNSKQKFTTLTWKKCILNLKISWSLAINILFINNKLLFACLEQQLKVMLAASCKMC